MDNAEPDIKDGYGQRPLLFTAGNGHVETVEKLLAANVDVNAAADIGTAMAGLTDRRTPLQAAAKEGHLDIAERLLAANADPNAADDENGGRTALQAAAEGGRLDIVERLLAANADVNAAAPRPVVLAAPCSPRSLRKVSVIVAASAGTFQSGSAALMRVCVKLRCMV